MKTWIGKKIKIVKMRKIIIFIIIIYGITTIQLKCIPWKDFYCTVPTYFITFTQFFGGFFSFWLKKSLKNSVKFRKSKSTDGIKLKKISNSLQK